jgi:hypothetical protein
MDSMRSLKGSLPSTSAGRRQSEQPGGGNQLYPAFQQAAVALTTLFKKAHENNTRAEEDGYQTAILDLLSFMDQENLGLQDGEGWRVREWATAKVHPDSRQGSANQESDEEPDEEKRARSSSPAMETNVSSTNPQETTSTTTTLDKTDRQSPRAESAPPIASTLSKTASTPTSHDSSRRIGLHAPSAEFTFHSAQQLPALDMEVETTTPGHSPNLQSGLPTFQVNFAPTRPSRGTPRHSRQTRQSTTALGPGAGSKRSLPFSGYFDFGDFGGGGGGGGGKRSKPS